MASSSEKTGSFVDIPDAAASVDSKPKAYEPIIKHTRIGIWDIYEEELPQWSFTSMESLMSPIIGLLDPLHEMKECFPYVLQMFRDVYNIPGCAIPVLMYYLVEILIGLLPAATTWIEGQMLVMMQTSIEDKTFDRAFLLKLLTGRVMTSALYVLLDRAEEELESKLRVLINRKFGFESFVAHARLDLPTFSKKETRNDMYSTMPGGDGQSNSVSEAMELIVTLTQAAVQVIAQVAVLFQVLKHQQDSKFMILLVLASDAIPCIMRLFRYIGVRLWAATTENKAFIAMSGWWDIIQDEDYRKDLVSGNGAEYAVAAFSKASEEVGSNAFSWSDARQKYLYQPHFGLNLFRKQIQNIPQFYLAYEAIQHPANIPVTMASMHLVTSIATEFSYRIYQMIDRASSVFNLFSSARKLYDLRKKPNVVPDGTIPFPEDTAQIQYGIELEFKNVSFKYPEADKYALKDISFRILPGQLCVLIGTNGAGKSTILNLATRLYDPEEGQILLGGHDIRTLRLHDVRQAVTVLFQDYTLFPLSIHENIAMGLKSNMGTPEERRDKVQRAAKLAGADSFIEKLPEKYETYLYSPTPTYMPYVNEGSKTYSGRTIDLTPVRDAAKIKSIQKNELSGGQMQKIAVARTFMSSVMQEDSKVGLLLFDEPSAALDPTAEYELFTSLRELRGSKTLFFSSHRFGNLTRHADIILVMNENGIVESGNHNELIAKDGEYAKVWNMQAEAFTKE